MSKKVVKKSKKKTKTLTKKEHEDIINKFIDNFKKIVDFEPEIIDLGLDNSDIINDLVDKEQYWEVHEYNAIFSILTGCSDYMKDAEGLMEKYAKSLEMDTINFKELQSNIRASTKKEQLLYPDSFHLMQLKLTELFEKITLKTYIVDKLKAIVDNKKRA